MPINSFFGSVYIIILNWNQSAITLECLTSLEKCTYKDKHVVIVDNGSTDDSVYRIRSAYPEYHIIENSLNLGYSEGNNVGIRYALKAGADWVLLLNNDTEVATDFLDRLLDLCCADPHIGIAGPTMYYMDPPDRLWGGENRIHWLEGQIIRKRMQTEVLFDELLQLPPVDVDYIDTCCALFRSEVFQKVGLLDNRYFINYDDVDLNIRVARAGYRILYVPSSRIWHKVSSAMGVGSPATTYYMTRNSLLLFGCSNNNLTRFLVLAKLLIRTLRTNLAWMLKPEYQSNLFRNKSAANWFALRDFFLRRFGPMGSDVRKVCFPAPGKG